MTALDPGSDTIGMRPTGGLIAAVGRLYLAGVLGLLTVAYAALVGVASMLPGRTPPLWQYLIAAGFGLIGGVLTWFAGKAYLRACRRESIRPAAFGLRWLGAPLALVSLIGIAFLLRARLLA